MSQCLQIIQDYGLRSLGFGKALLPSADITLCHQFVLIGSGVAWNIYFACLALLSGFVFATLLAIAKNSPQRRLRIPAASFVYFFRGTPLFIQFFFAYQLFVMLPKLELDIALFGQDWLLSSRAFSKAWLGALIVLFLNTSAYSAEIFHGALRAVPTNDIEAAKAYGLNSRQTFLRITWPTMLRLAWPSYTNEAIFLFHATTLVFFSAFPSWSREGDALYYASYFADKTFNPFITYPIAASYFILFTLMIIGVFGVINRRLNLHITVGANR